MTLEQRLRPVPGGWWDRFVGPGASTLENVGILGLAAAGVLAGDHHLAPGAPTRRRILMRLVAADLWGGAWANNTPTSAAWYERPGQGVRQHLGFAAPHFVHAGMIAHVDHAEGRRSGGSAAYWVLGHYAWMLACTAMVTAAAPRTRLAIAAAATGAGLLLDRRLGRSATAPWFAPLYYAKLLIGHAAGSMWRVASSQ